MKHKVIVRADNVECLMTECARVTWDKNELSVLEVLVEQLGPDAMSDLTPEQLIAYGFQQGVGHVISVLATEELIPVLRDSRRPKKSAPRPEKTEEN